MKNTAVYLKKGFLFNKLKPVFNMAIMSMRVYLAYKNTIAIIQQ